MIPKLEIKPYRKGFAIFAGVSRLSPKFATEVAAAADLEKHDTLYLYWSGSASVSVENTPAKVVKI